MEDSSKLQESLNKTLEDLSTEMMEDSHIGAFSDVFRLIYSEGFRHSYSSITGIMLRLQKENNDAFVYVMGNLSMIIKYMTATGVSEEVVEKMKKLEDHISLESTRYDQLYRAYKDKVDDAQKSMKDVQEQYERINRQYNDVNGQYDEIKTLSKNTRTEAMQLKTEMVTILSIFAAIVLTFMGGMSFTASTFHGIAEASVYRLVAVSCICGLVIFNTVVALIYLITRIINRPVAMNCRTPDCSCEKRCKSITVLRKRYPLIFWFNMMILFLLIVDAAAWVINADRIVEFVQSCIWNRGGHSVQGNVKGGSR